MSQQGTGRAAGNFARRALGIVVNTILDHFQHSEELPTLADTENATLFDGEEVTGVAVVFDTTNDTVALVEVQGSTGGATVLASGAGSYGTSSGTDAQTNVYYNTDHYEIENQTGGDVDYQVLTIRVP
jgi:hypothetical protein